MLFLSNTCVGASLHKLMLPAHEYNSPFIGTLIPNDTSYLKLIDNLRVIIRETPSLGPPLEKWNTHPAIIRPYPVIFLGDIEIHCIHESDNVRTLDTFTRRLIRLRKFVENPDNRIYATLSFSELLNDHDDPYEFITKFCQPSSDTLTKIFLGPSKYKGDNKNYIPVEQWDTISLLRVHAAYAFNDQNFNTQMFAAYVNQLC